MDEQLIRLTLQTRGQETIDNLRKSTENYRALLDDLGQRFSRGEISAEEFTQQQANLGRELDRQSSLLKRLEDARDSEARAARAAAEAAQAAAAALQVEAGAAVRASDTYEVLTSDIHATDAAFDALLASTIEQTNAQRAMARVLGDVHPAITTVTGSAKAATDAKRNLGLAAMQASYAFQDFAQNGLPAVANNIAPPLALLGGPAGLTAAISTLGVVAALAAPKIAEWGRGIIQGANAIPAATDEADRLANVIGRINERLDAYRKQSSLTNQELANYNTLTARAAQLEEQRNALLAQRRDLEALNTAKPRIEQERGSGFVSGVGEAGGGEFVADAVVEALKQRGFVSPVADAEQGARQIAQDLMRQAMAGSGSATQEVLKLLRDSGRGGMAATIEAETPEGKAAARAAEAKRQADEKGQAARKEAGEAIGRMTDDEIRRQEERRAAQEKAAAAQDQRLRDQEARQQQQEGQRIAGAVSANTQIDEAAAAMAAQMRQQGASEQQIVEQLVPRITRAILDSFPDLSRSQAMAASEGMAAQAAQQSVGALLGIGQQNVDMTGQTIGTVNGMMGTVENMGRQLASYGAVLREIQQRNRQTMMSTFGPNGGR